MNCVTHSVKFEYLYLRKLSMIRNKVVWDKHYYSDRFTVRNIFLLCYSRFRLMCNFTLTLCFVCYQYRPYSSKTFSIPDFQHCLMNNYIMLRVDYRVTYNLLLFL